MSAVLYLAYARAQIDSPTRWMRGSHSGGRYGQRYDASAAMALALGHWDDEDRHPATKALRKALPKRFERLSDFNDQATHAEVLSLFDKAIAQVERKNRR